MSPSQANPPDEIARHIQDTIASDSSLREGLQDDAATPLVEWGARQATVLGARMAAAGASPADEEAVAGTAHRLRRLMTRITWVVTYRDKKDTAWLTRTFHKINALCQEIYGPDAPTMTEDEIAGWIASQTGRDDATLIRELTERLTPDAAETPPDASPAPGDSAPPFGGAGLPGRGERPERPGVSRLQDLFNRSPDQTPPATSGEEAPYDE